MQSINLLYKTKNGFYCDNCGILRGYPYNDPCKPDCNSVWCVDPLVIANKESQREKSREQKEQGKMMYEDQLSRKQNEDKPEKCVEDDEEIPIPAITTPAPLSFQLGIPFLDDESSDDDKIYNGGLREFLKQKFLASIDFADYQKSINNV